MHCSGRKRRRRARLAEYRALSDRSQGGAARYQRSAGPDYAANAAGRYTLRAARGGPKLQKAGNEEQDNCVLNLDSPKKELACQKSPILGLANALSNLLQSPVVDGTGLSGSYDFTLSWDGDDILSAVPDAMERLGLKLEMKKVPAEVLVIDSVERPSEN
jgi:uncharacterized protein (TIGR03435 family)